MDLLKAAYSNTWEAFDQLNEEQALEPLELRVEQEAVIIARIKKLAKDPAEHFPNALALVHKSYEEQEWERQSSIGDIVRPSPSDRKAWEQYEGMIKLAVKVLSKFRGSKGDWRTDRFDTVPTNQRASMSSMAGARVKETVEVRWDSIKDLDIMMESFVEQDSTYQNDCSFFDTTIGSVADKISADASNLGFIVAETESTECTMLLILYNEQCNVVDRIQLKYK